jgi:predicted DNA-binding transcriptional regulator YafY
MSHAARLGKIMTMLRARRHGIATKQFLDHLGISRSTFFRDIEALRNQRQPIVYDKEMDGYVLDEGADPAFVREELPGVMLTARECYALLTLHNVLRSIDPGFLDEFVEPLRGVLKQIVINQRFTSLQLNQKVRVALGSFGKPKPTVFSKVAEALVRDRRLEIGLAEWSAGPRERVVSPQRIELTPQGWALHVLDHRDGRVRAIPLPEITRARVLGTVAARRAEFDEIPPEPARPSDAPAR